MRWAIKIEVRCVFQVGLCLLGMALVDFPARAQTESECHCDSFGRRVTVLQKEKSYCELIYQKSEEDFKVNHRLWWAKHHPNFCAQKAAALTASLSSKGFNCIEIGRPLVSQPEERNRVITAFSPEPTSQSILSKQQPTPPFRPFIFGTYFTSYVQTSPAANSNSALLSWSPELPLSEPFSLVSDLGLTLLNTEIHKFLVFFLDMRAKYRLTPSVEFDLGVGVQNWTRGEGGAFLMTGVGLTYQLPAPLFDVLQGIRVGFDYVARANSPTYQFLIGAEWDFGSQK